MDARLDIMSITTTMLSPLRLVFDRWIPAYRVRVVPQFADWCDEGSIVFDFCCDDGTTALAIQAQRPSLTIQGVDIQGHRPCRIPRTLYDGKRLPFDDDSFDVVLAFDVLHHTPDIGAALKELARVARRYVILKEHAVESRVANFFVTLSDVATNLPYGISCTCNYPSLAQWHAHFAAAGLEPTHFRNDLPLGIFASPRQNPIFKLAKVQERHSLPKASTSGDGCAVQPSVATIHQLSSVGSGVNSAAS